MRRLLAFAALVPGIAGAQAMPGMTMPMPMPMPTPTKPVHRMPRRPAAPHPVKAGQAPRTMPATPMPDKNMPDRDMPDRDMPDRDMPDRDMPGMDMPGMDMPGVDVAPMPPAPASGTDLSPGNAPAPPPPDDHYADRDYPAGAMARARHRMMVEQGGQIFHQLLFNLAEVQVHDGRTGYRWDAEAWIGGDRDRLVLKSEGDGAGRSVDAAEVQALYSRAIGPYFDLQAGVRHDVAPAPRSYATAGIEGLAPFMFQTEAALFLSDRGDLLARAEGWYDERITQRMVLQPRVELNFAAQDVPRSRIGAGLSDAELGLRLRYEIRREFAPYVGLSWERKVGATAGYARAMGQDASQTSLVAGIRFWF